MIKAGATSFLLISVFALGTLGALGFSFGAWYLHGAPLWSADMPAIWVIGLVTTALFIFPVWIFLRCFGKRCGIAFLFASGALSGPAFVCILLLLRGERFSLVNYVTADGVLIFHYIFALIGLIFTLAFMRFSGRSWGQKGGNEW